MDSGADAALFPFHLCLGFKAQHQPACDFTAPMFDPSLESSQLPWRESAGRGFLQTEEQIFGIGVGLFVEPLLNLWPDCFKWVRPSAPGSRSAGSLTMCRTHFAIAPHRRKTGDKAAQFRRLEVQLEELRVLCLGHGTGRTNGLSGYERHAQT